MFRKNFQLQLKPYPIKSSEYGESGKVVHPNEAIFSLFLMIACSQALSYTRGTLSIGKI